MSVFLVSQLNHLAILLANTSFCSCHIVCILALKFLIIIQDDVIIQYCGKFTLVGCLIRVTLLRAVCIGNDDDADADDDDAVIP